MSEIKNSLGHLYSKMQVTEKKVSVLEHRLLEMIRSEIREIKTKIKINRASRPTRQYQKVYNMYNWSLRR